MQIHIIAHSSNPVEAYLDKDKAYNRYRELCGEQYGYGIITLDITDVAQPVIKADVECPACNRWRHEFGGANFCANCGRPINTA